MSEKKPVSDALKRAHKKYMEQYVEIKVRMTPEKRDQIKAFVSGTDESVTAFINRLIDEAMAKNKE